MKQRNKDIASISDSVTMIVRSAGERSIDLCKKLIRDQGFNENIFVTRETPFSSALKKSYEIGISEAKPWTFCVDADVLLREHSTQSLLKFAQNQDSNIFEVQGFVHDKFFAIPRQAGNHLYRTSLLTKAIDLIPDEGLDIRPESHVLRIMQKRGYPYKTFPSIIGLHDFEQYYFDIYRKSFVQAHKHLNYTDKMVPHWKENVETDFDYKVALFGFTDGILNSAKVFIDKKQELYQEKFRELELTEKESISKKEIDLYKVENFLKEQLEDEYLHLSNDNIHKTIITKLNDRFRAHGVIKSLALFCSLSMIKIGNKIKKKITQQRR